MPATALGPSKYLKVAARIEAALQSGAWDGGKMPSVRGIAAEYGISVVTASRALQVLRDKGLIQTIERSGCYRIPPPTADRWAVCLRLTPGTLQRFTLSLAQSGFQALARRSPMHLAFDAFDLTPALTREAAAAAAAQAKADGLKGVFLLPSRVSDEDGETDRTFLAGCDDAGLPAVLVERTTRGATALTHDLVAIDDVAAARECTNHLLAAGRRRVGIVVASPVSSHHDRVAGYLHAVHEGGHGPHTRKTPPPPVVIRQPVDLPTKEAHAAVADEVQRHKLDGVVCYQDYTALGLIVELLNRRAKVPDDVAVVGFDNLPLGEDFGISLTTYDYPAEAMAERAVEAMRVRIAHPHRPPARVLVPGRLIVRASAPAAP